MTPMLVLPLVVAPRLDGSGSTAFRNCSGMISRPSYITGSIRVMPTFCSTFEVRDIGVAEGHPEADALDFGQVGFARLSSSS